MAGPWEKFQTVEPVEQGPWTKFAQSPATPASAGISDLLFSPVQPKPEQQSIFRQVADIPLGVAKGAVQGVRMIADAFGAGTDTSNTIRGAENYLGDLMSAQAKNDQQEIARIMKDAEDKGILDQVKAGLQAFTVAPVDTLTSALGTAAPAIVAALGAKVLGAGALVTTGIGALTGAGMGAGVVKGTIYEETKKALIEAGVPEPVAEERAQRAQEYGGKNLDQILLGAGLGGVAAVGPVEKGVAAALARRISTNVAAREAAVAVPAAGIKGAVAQRAGAAAAEAIPEAVQAGQEKVAENIALQREGFDVPTFRGAVGAATLEGLAGAGLGAVVGGERRAPPPPAPAPAPAPAEPEKPKVDVESKEFKKKQADYARYVQRVQELEAREAELTSSEKGKLTFARNRVAELKPEIDEALGVATGEENVARFRTPAGGAGFEIFEFTEPPSPAGVGAPPPTGMGAAGEPAGAPAAGAATEPAALAPAAAPAPVEAPPAPAPAPAAAPAPVEPKKLEGAPKSSLDEDLGVLDSILGAPPSVLKSAEPRAELTPAQIKQLDGVGRKYGLSREENETPAQFQQRIRAAIYDLQNAKPYEPSAEQIQLYEETAADFNRGIEEEIQQVYDEVYKEKIAGGSSDENAKKAAEEAVAPYRKDLLPEYKKLSNDDKLVYFKYNIFKNSQLEHDRAASALSNYISGKKETSGTHAKTEEIAARKARELEQALPRESYKFHSATYGGNKTISYSFPAWNDLSDESQRLFTTINKNDTPAELDFAFRSVKNQIRKEKAEQQSREALEKAESEATRQMELVLERALAKQPAGKGAKLPKEVIDALLRGDAESALSILSERAQGLKTRIFPFNPKAATPEQRILSFGESAGVDTTSVRFLERNVRYDQARRLLDQERRSGASKERIAELEARVQELNPAKSYVRVRDKVAREVFRRTASVLRDIPGFKVNFVVDENMSPDTFGEYDAATNTIYVSPRGLDEATLLHELVHAATVQIIHKYYTNKSLLTPRAIAAVEHIQNIAASAKRTLSDKYPNAFENLYEFVAYAMTDMDFQLALANIRVPSLARITVGPQQGATPEQQRAIDEAVQYDKDRFDALEQTNPDLYRLAKPIRERVLARESGLVAPPSEKTLWNYFTDTLAWLYKIFSPTGKTEVFLLPTEKTRASEAARKQAVREKEKRAAVEVRAEKLREQAEFEQKSDTELARIAQDQLTQEEIARKQEAARREKSKVEDETEFEPVEDKEIAALFDEAPVEEEEEQKFANELDLKTARGLTNLQRAVNVEPGYKGNLLLEFSAAFQDILSAPEAGIEQLAGKESLGTTLQARKPKETKKAEEPKPFSEKTDEEKRTQLLNQLTPKERGGRAFLKRLMTNEGYEWLVQKFQNERRAVKKVFDRAEKFGIVKRIGDDLNDVWGQLTRSTGMAVDIYETVMRPHVEKVHAGVEAYAKKLGISVNDALGHLHAILEARHEGERRQVKFLLKVPLDNEKAHTINNLVDGYGKPVKEKHTGAAWREYILKELSRADMAPDEASRKAYAKYLRGLLEQIAKTPSMQAKGKLTTFDAKGKKHEEIITPEMFNPAHEMYNVIAERSPEQIAEMQRLFDKPEHKAEIDAVVAAIKDVHEETKRLNREANYWSIPVDNVALFYDYKNYVPFKGKPNRTTLDDQIGLETTRIGGELQEAQDTFEGRKSESENPLLQSLAEGASAAMRAGRKDLTLAIKNAIKDKILTGEILKDKIQFADRYLGGERKQEFGGPSRIFHYNEDGTIEILEIKNQQQLEAIRRAFRTSSPIIDIINSATSLVGQTHTRYNPAFAPMNFVRDTFTNAGILGAEMGPVMAGRLIKTVAADVSSGGLYRTLQFSQLYSKGDFARLNLLAGGTAAYDSLTPEQQYYRDLLDYVKLGGKVSYLQGIAAKGALDGLMKEIGRSGIVKSKEQVDKFFDIYNEIFELAARAGTYRMMKEEFAARGESKEEARVHAVEYAKNLANFEQVGQWGKNAGAFFMFFRPAATGAVRAIDSLKPILGFNEADFRAAAQQEGRTPEQIERAVKKMQEERDIARRMVAGLTGTGVAMYLIAMMMSGDDDEGRNRIATDDMARWARYARFFVPGYENPVQIPWGFGPGAFAAAGAQIASLASSGGRVSFMDALSNIASIGLDSFLPLPFARISPVDNFPAFMVDTITPSLARPFLEYVMNLDGLGREIYNNRQTKYGDAYTGGDNIPEIYKDAARFLSRTTEGAVDWSPNTMYFFANSFADGFARMMSAAYNASLTVSGQKDFDPKNDALFVSSFIGTKSNFDARQFSKAEGEIKELTKRLDSLKNSTPDLYAKFVSENPDKFALVQYYNQQVNGALRNLRQAANTVRANPNLTPGERKEQVDQIVRMQNTVKSQILQGFEVIGGKL